MSIDGTAVAGDVVSILIEDRKYTYTVQEGDTLNSIRDAFVRLISADPLVEAFASSIWTRVRLRARIPGPEANGLRISVSSPEGSSAILTPFNEFLCCANEAGSLITEDNPALPGETIVVYATGLGLVKPSEAQSLVRTGVKYEGPEFNEPLEFVSSLAGGKTANVLATGLKPGMIGIYEVHLELNSGQTDRSAHAGDHRAEPVRQQRSDDPRLQPARLRRSPLGRCFLRPVAPSLHHLACVRGGFRGRVEECADSCPLEDEAAEVLVGFHQVVQTGRSEERFQRLSPRRASWRCRSVRRPALRRTPRPSAC